MTQYVSPVARPSAYPTELERQLTLSDGRTVSVRPVVPADSAQLVLEMEGADPDTIYQRFFRHPVHLDPATLDRMTRLDYRDRLALAVFADDGAGVAIARYETSEPGVAEVAVVVQPEWRRAGIATTLLRMLEEAAIERGITRFTAVYLPANQPIISRLTHLGFTIGDIEGGLGTASKELVAAG